MRTRRLFGQNVPVDEAFDARVSADVERMRKALPLATNAIDKHFLYLGLVEQSYRRRAESGMAELCEEMARRHNAEFPALLPDLLRDMPNIRHQPSYMTLCRLLREQGREAGLAEAMQEGLAVTGLPWFATSSTDVHWRGLREALLEAPVGISQSDFCKRFPAEQQDEVRSELYWAAKRGVLIREKKGRGYVLLLPVRGAISAGE